MIRRSTLEAIGGFDPSYRYAEDRDLFVRMREHGLTPAEWGVMSRLRLGDEACRSSPGELASDLDLSTGAMTSRLDRLEAAGLVRRLPDPEDRRGVVVAHFSGPLDASSMDRYLALVGVT